VATVSSKAVRVSELLRLPPGPVDLTAIDTRATPGAPGGKAKSRAEFKVLGTRLADLQERLYAEGRVGERCAMLVVLQGMDTSGKGGTIRHVFGRVDPQGVSVKAFGPPTREERAHDFLWRIRAALPRPSIIGIFDRSHYEDVVAVRVHNVVPRSVWSRRYATINRFEDRLRTDGIRVVKVFLHISPEEQRERLLARLDDPTKHWKFNPRDIDERLLWHAYQEAYEAALERCNTTEAPWHVVPADRKWYRNWAISKLLVEQLEGMNPQWPNADFDVDSARARLVQEEVPAEPSPIKE
jgi:PPK2 family polyphosphate:nucleotide phosphotransferase